MGDKSLAISGLVKTRDLMNITTATAATLTTRPQHCYCSLSWLALIHKLAYLLHVAFSLLCSCYVHQLQASYFWLVWAVSLRQGLAVSPWLLWNFLHKGHWPWIYSTSLPPKCWDYIQFVPFERTELWCSVAFSSLRCPCNYLLSAGTASMSHYLQLGLQFLPRSPLWALSSTLRPPEH